jgi:hypothetical protein
VIASVLHTMPGDAVHHVVYAEAVDTMHESMRLPKLQRQSSFKGFVSRLKAAELEGLAQDMRDEAYRRKELSTFAKLGVFPDEDTLREPAALLTFFRLLVSCPLVPIAQYNLALANPLAIAEHMRRHQSEQWKLIQGVARQLDRYRVRSVDYRKGYERENIERLEKELLPFLLRPDPNRLGLPDGDFARAMAMMRALFATVDKYDKAAQQPEPEPEPEPAQPSGLDAASQLLTRKSNHIRSLFPARAHTQRECVCDWKHDSLTKCCACRMPTQF